MSNKTLKAATVAMIQAADLDDPRIHLQRIVDAQKQGLLSGPLTDWLANESWNIGRLVVCDKFVVNTSYTTKAGISGMGKNFQDWFFSLIEVNPVVPDLIFFTLETVMHDKDIVLKLGGVAKSITSLGEVYGKMEKQPKGPKSPAGDLITDGSANIFYVPQVVEKLYDKHFSYVVDGQTITEGLTDPQYLFKVGDQWLVLRAVVVYWFEVGWYVSASSVESTDRWGAGSRAFSRNSFKSSVPQETATS